MSKNRNFSMVLLMPNMLDGNSDKKLPVNIRTYNKESRHQYVRVVEFYGKTISLALGQVLSVFCKHIVMFNLGFIG